MAEQIKSPLLLIARQAELAQTTPDSSVLHNIEYTADMGLRLIDSYLLSVRLQSMPNLELEPVTVSSVLEDSAQALRHLARQYGCDLKVDLAGKYGPVMAHRKSLQSAYEALGYAFIQTLPPADQKHEVVLAVHGSRNGLVTGVFSPNVPVSADTIRRGKVLHGTAAQAMPGMTAHPGAGVFIANSLLSALSAPLKSARHRRLNGLAATLLPSQQLQLI